MCDLLRATEHLSVRWKLGSISHHEQDRLSITLKLNTNYRFNPSCIKGQTVPQKLLKKCAVRSTLAPTAHMAILLAQLYRLSISLFLSWSVCTQVHTFATGWISTCAALFMLIFIQYTVTVFFASKTKAHTCCNYHENVCFSVRKAWRRFLSKLRNMHWTAKSYWKYVLIKMNYRCAGTLMASYSTWLHTLIIN